jgi:hypothetical protein
MLQLVYILAFTVIAFFAISNLIRSLITLSADSQRGGWSAKNYGNGTQRKTPRPQMVPHPELLDERGQPINEPLLVMRSVSVEDARQQLDNLYNLSPSQVKEDKDELED